MSNGTASGVVYRIEARTSYPQPQEVNGTLLGGEWQQISPTASSIGVPNDMFSSADRRGFLTYEAAQALRWWFCAAARNSYCLETRLVAYDYEETWKATRKAEEEAQPSPYRPWDEFAPASGIEVAAASETRSGSTEGESPVGKAETPKGEHP